MLCEGSRAFKDLPNNSTIARACLAARRTVLTEPPFTLTVDSLSRKTIGKLRRSQSAEFAATHHYPGPEFNRQSAKRNPSAPRSSQPRMRLESLFSGD